MGYISCFSKIVCLLCLVGCRQQEPTVTFVFAGDLMPDRGIRNAIEKKGIEPLFQHLPYDFNAVDYAVANMECAVCDSSIEKENKKFAFRANPEWMGGIRKHGINIVSLANNHSSDYGDRGLLQTLDCIRKSDMYAIGANKNRAWAGVPLLISKGKIKVALFSSSLLKSDSRYMCHASVAELEKRIRIYKANHPCTVMILLLHWGVEGKEKPENEQVQNAHSLINAGVDVIVGTHPHVVQPIEQYKKGLILYSLGNFIFDNQHSPENTGMMARIKIGQGSVVVMDTATYKIYTGYGH